MELPTSLKGLTQEEQEYYKILNDPVLWAAAMFGWKARDYQEPVLEEAPNCKQLVLRLGRRLGKTEMMCILILWYAYTQINMGPNDQYDILILAPYEKQIDLIFERLHELIDLSDEFKHSVKRDIHHQIELHNGTVIRGITVGAKSGTGAASTRGQRADLIVLDEVDYMGEADITNVLNIRNEAPERIRILAASTPSGNRSRYYEWCVKSSHDFQAVTDETGAGFVKYTMKERKKRDGNGWTHFYAPSVVNKELLKINPDTSQTYLEDLKEELTEMRYIQEVMAEFGESEHGVFQKKYIDAAVQRGRDFGIAYHVRNFDKVGPRILAIDWDKYGASTNMVGVQLNQASGVFEPFVRKEIPRGEFTFDNGVKAAIELNEIFNFDYVMVDSGHGEHQIETLKKYGLAHPNTGLAYKTIRVNFSEKVKMLDPILRKMDKKDIKPFMVNNAVIAFERGKIALNPEDKKMIRQFEEYHIKSIGASGRPVFGEQEEHIVDCIMMAIHGFNVYYTDMLKVTFSTKIISLPGQNDKKTEDQMIVSRSIESPESKNQSRPLIMSANTESSGRSRTGFHGKRSMPSRSRF